MKSADTSRKQVFLNLLTNGLNFLVNVAFGLVMAPFLIKYLGLGSFGIIQIALSISAYMGMVSTSLNQANNRFVSLAITANDERGAVSTVNTTLLLYAVFFLGILPFILGLAFYSNLFLDIPDPDIVTSKYMFVMIVLSYLLVMVTTVFVSPLYAKNRLDIIQGINIVRNILKLILTIGFVLYISKSVDAVGLGHLVAAVISTTIAVVFFLKFLPSYKFAIRDFDKVKAKEILHLSWWTLVQYVGWLFFLQTDIILINVLLGNVASGNYGVIMQWTNLLFNVATVTSVVISPIILIKYSQRDYGQLRTFLNKSIRLQGAFISLVTALVFVFSEEILVVWLDATYASLAPAMKVAVAHIALTQAIRPIYALNTAYNKVQRIGKVTVVAGLAHLVTAFVLIKFFGYGIMATILSGAVYCLLLNVIYLPAYASKYLNQRKRILYKCLIPSFACFVVVYFVGEAFKSYLVADSWISLILAGGVTAIVSLFVVFYVILNYEEKKMVTSFLSKS